MRSINTRGTHVQDRLEWGRAIVAAGGNDAAEIFDPWVRDGERIVGLLRAAVHGEIDPRSLDEAEVRNWQAYGRDMEQIGYSFGIPGIGAWLRAGPALGSGATGVDAAELESAADADRVERASTQASDTERVNVVFPETDLSITDGTVLGWFRQPGDAVALEESLVEISTDQFELEVPAPVAGTLSRILVQAGATVSVGTVLAEIDTDRDDAAPAVEPSTGG